MAKDYDSYSFKNRAVDNIQSRSNTANDPEDNKKNKKRVTRTTNSDGSVTKRRTKRSGDVVIKTVKKPKRVKSDPTPKPTVPKDNRTKEQKKSDMILQKKISADLKAKADANPKPKEKKVKYAPAKKTKKTKKSVDKVVIEAEDNSSPKPKGGYKPIRRGIQFNFSKTGGGGRRRNNNAIQKGKGFFGKNKRI